MIDHALNNIFAIRLLGARSTLALNAIVSQLQLVPLLLDLSLQNKLGALLLLYMLAVVFKLIFNYLVEVCLKNAEIGHKFVFDEK